MAIDSRILIADGTRGTDFLLRDMLPEESTSCAFDVVRGGREALERLGEQGYDMVIANLRRLDPAGLELVQKVRSISRATRVMLMSAYDYEEVGVEGKRRFIVYDHLTEPLQQGKSVKAADQVYGKMAISQKGILILSDERLAAITQQLANMRSDIEAQSIILANIVGDLITSVGPIKGMDLDSFIPLVAIGFAASSEMRNYFSEKELGFNLNYHEGERYAVYSANVGSAKPSGGNACISRARADTSLSPSLRLKTPAAQAAPYSPAPWPMTADGAIPQLFHSSKSAFCRAKSAGWA